MARNDKSLQPTSAGRPSVVTNEGLERFGFHDFFLEQHCHTRFRRARRSRNSCDHVSHPALENLRRLRIDCLPFHPHPSRALKVRQDVEHGK
jgi:hypothetical protein